MAQVLTVKQVASELPAVKRLAVDRVQNAGRSGVPGRTDPPSRRRPSLGAGDRRKNGAALADATETARCRGVSGTADAVGAARDAAESRGEPGRGARQLDGAPPVS